MSEQEAQGQINTVNVYSIDEERLRFRVVVAIRAIGNYEGRGQYQVDIPIPTSFTNSHEYSQCLIKCDSMSAMGSGAAGLVSWCNPAAAGLKIASLELGLNVPTSQAVKSSIIGANAGAVGQIIPTDTTMGSWRQICPGQIVTVGDGATFGTVATSVNKAWLSISGRAENPVLAGNPFGKQVSITFRDPLSDQYTYLQVPGAGGLADVGYYVMQFEITMVPNS